MNVLAKFVMTVSLLSVLNGTSAVTQTAAPPFGFESVQRLAEDAAKKAYEAPPEAPKAEELDYDRYRQIRFRKERTIWRGEGLNFELQLLPTGWLFKLPIEINVVDARRCSAHNAGQCLLRPGSLGRQAAAGDAAGLLGLSHQRALEPSGSLR